MLAVVGVLFGIILGQFFKFFVLIPASGLAAFLVLTNPMQTDSVWGWCIPRQPPAFTVRRQIFCGWMFLAFRKKLGSLLQQFDVLAQPGGGGGRSERHRSLTQHKIRWRLPTTIRQATIHRPARPKRERDAKSPGPRRGANRTRGETPQSLATRETRVANQAKGRLESKTALHPSRSRKYLYIII
jgi:hypothetical protein